MVAVIVQRLLWFILKPAVHLLLSFSISGQERLKHIRGPLIIAVNHKSILDPVFLGMALPFRLHLLPIRFMAAVEKFDTYYLGFFYHTGLLRVFYFFTGCFRAVYARNNGLTLKQALTEPLAILSEGGTVIMFIEGKRIMRKELGKGKRGTAALSLMTGAQVLPAAIRGNLGLRPHNFFRKNVSVVFGEPFVVQPLGPNTDGEYVPETERIMEKIDKLHNGE